MGKDHGGIPLDDPLAWTTYGSWLPGDERAHVRLCRSMNRAIETCRADVTRLQTPTTRSVESSFIAPTRPFELV
jgi:hypothetical protein